MLRRPSELARLLRVIANPRKPVGTIKTAWEEAKRRAGKTLVPDDPDAPPLECRFHDLRHTAVSRMLEAGIPVTMVAKIVGWSASTMIQMAKRYSHFSVDELRGCMDATISQDSSVKHPVLVKTATGGAA